MTRSSWWVGLVVQRLRLDVDSTSVTGYRCETGHCSSGFGRYHSPPRPESRSTMPAKSAKSVAKSVPYEVRSSDVHGLGLFALRDIAAKELIGVATGEPTSEDGMHVLWLVDEDGSEEGLQMTNDLRFVNHADDANATFDGEDLVALRKIKAGSEITFDYSAVECA